jgi:chemotaxis protein MotC
MRATAVTLLALLLSPHNGVVRSEASEFYELVRDLTSAQNRMATGDAAAGQLTSNIMGEIERRLPEVTASQWKVPKNDTAAAIYLLSGGSARTMRRVYSAGTFANDSNALIQASLAYAEGRSREANALLGKIDGSSYPYTLKGHILLVRGGLLVGVDDTNAMRLLEQARLLMPGSLVEEAALRREIGIVDPVANANKLLLLCERYSGSYRSSPFAAQFWIELAKLARRAPAQLDMRNRAILDSLIQDAPSSVRATLNFTLLRSLTMSGDVGGAASQLAKTEAAPGTLAANRRKLYSALIDILSGKTEDGIRAARAVDPSSLPGEDIEARDLFLSASAALIPPPDEREKRPKPAASTDAGAPPEIVKEAEDALASSQAALEKGLHP